MKRLLYIVGSLVLIMSFLLAGEQDVEKIKTNYKSALESNNPGVRFSGLFNLVYMKSQYPEISLEMYNRQLQKIIKEDNEAIIRVDANLAYLYLNSEDLAYVVKVQDKENPKEFFNTLYRTLNVQNVTMNRM